MTEITVAATQMACTWDLEKNVENAVALVREAAGRGARIVLLQELFETPYFCKDRSQAHFALARPAADHPLLARMSALAAELGVVLPVSFFERANAAYYNSLAVIDADGRNLGLYRKSHIPDGPGYQEKFYFTPGDTGFKVWRTRHATIGAAVCWDQWFPEAARLTTLSGAQILFYPTAIGWQFDEGDAVDLAQHDAWEIVQRSHAITNGVFVAATNRVGREDEIRFWGQSFVADPFGRVLARASSEDEETLCVECDLGLVEKVRRDWPFLRDRRIDAYADIQKRFRDD